MKKRNIVRLTAFIMAVLMCLSTGLTLFAEGVDTTEVTSESESSSQTTSGGDAVASTRSEIGQKILGFKNSDEYKGKVIFKGNVYQSDTSELDLTHSDIYYALKDDVKIGIYNSETDSLKFCGTLLVAEGELDTVDNSNFYKSTIEEASVKSYKDGVSDDIFIGLSPLDRTSSMPADYKTNYICLFDKSATSSTLDDSLLFSCSVEDSVNYAKSSLIPDNTDSIENKSTSSVKCEPVKSDDGSVQQIKVTIDFSIVDSLDYSSSEFDDYFNQRDFIKQRRNTATVVKVLKGDNVIASVLTTDDGTGVIAGSYPFYITSGNGKYNYKIETLLSGLGRINTDISGEFELTEFKSNVTNEPISDEEFEAATVSFSGIPNEAYTNDSVTLKMSTDKKCKMSFNGSSLANNEYTTSADFIVTRNGTYSYVATNEQGVATNGTFEVTFFKDKVEDAINDPLQSDLVSAKTDSTLSQTGLYQTWLIILAVILCSFGILLIVNQKYHFLDKFVRRFKHESN